MDFIKVNAFSSARGFSSKVDCCGKQVHYTHINQGCAILISILIDAVADAIQRVGVEKPLIKQEYKEATKDQTCNRNQRKTEHFIFRNWRGVVQVRLDIWKQDRGNRCT